MQSCRGVACSAACSAACRTCRSMSGTSLYAAACSGMQRHAAATTLRILMLFDNLGIEAALEADLVVCLQKWLILPLYRTHHHPHRHPRLGPRGAVRLGTSMKAPKAKKVISLKYVTTISGDPTGEIAHQKNLQVARSQFFSQPFELISSQNLYHGVERVLDL